MAISLLTCVQEMRRPGIEPGLVAWEATVLPLDQRRVRRCTPHAPRFALSPRALTNGAFVVALLAPRTTSASPGASTPRYCPPLLERSASTPGVYRRGNVAYVGSDGDVSERPLPLARPRCASGRPLSISHPRKAGRPAIAQLNTTVASIGAFLSIERPLTDVPFVTTLTLLDVSDDALEDRPVPALERQGGDEGHTVPWTLDR